MYQASFIVEFNEPSIICQLSDPTRQREAFGIVVRKYSEQLYWKIRHIVLTHEDADDVLQNTFIKAWNNLDTFRHDSKLSTWLYRIAINESLDFVRKKQVRQQIDADAEYISLSSRLMADEYFDGDKMQAQLLEAVSRLPEVQKTVFTLKYFDEMKYSEISRILGTSEGALKASYHHAVKKISDYLHTLE